MKKIPNVFSILPAIITLLILDIFFLIIYILFHKHILLQINNNYPSILYINFISIYIALLLSCYLTKKIMNTEKINIKINIIMHISTILIVPFIFMLIIKIYFPTTLLLNFSDISKYFDLGIYGIFLAISIFLSNINLITSQNAIYSDIKNMPINENKHRNTNEPFNFFIINNELTIIFISVIIYSFLLIIITNENYVKIIVALTAILVALIGGLFACYNTRRNSTIKIAENRQAWVNSLRIEFSSYISIIESAIETKTRKESDLLSKTSLIYLYLNPNDSLYQYIKELIVYLNNTSIEFTKEHTDKEFEVYTCNLKLAIGYFHQLCQLLLKIEWNRIKDELRMQAKNDEYYNKTAYKKDEDPLSEIIKFVSEIDPKN